MKIFRFFRKIIIIFIAISLFFVCLFRFIDPPGTMLMLEQKMGNFDKKQQRTWRDFNDISDNIKIAVIAAEDQNFANHFGFDLRAIEQAITHNENNQTIRGASTITQQVAKNLFLWPSRSFVRKAFEFWFTLWIELFWSKQRTLEIYLNSVEWGEGIFGIQAASHHYFHTSANNLTLDEACLLAAILPNPRNLSPVNPNENIRNKANWIKKQIQNLDKNTYLKEINDD
ncbi:monofunctional biosynthetic peptidoglycan transglycosylase [Orbus wheelerorum]|uniref:monofunctional biosynthetic peptidoglycan transglycosylase n=1 Tax=Orbus wheelerorum TaxID=3074111 RepID=UPI00370D2A3A